MYVRVVQIARPFFCKQKTLDYVSYSYYNRMFITDTFIVIGQTSVAQSQVKWINPNQSIVFTITTVFFVTLFAKKSIKHFLILMIFSVK